MKLKGTAYWAKIVGKPRPGYGTTPNNGPEEWSIDISLEGEDLKEFKKLNLLSPKVKNKGDERGDFIQFRRKAISQEGAQNNPFDIYAPNAEKWDGRTLIGNGSKIFFQFGLDKAGERARLYSIQIAKLVPYEVKSGYEDVAQEGASDEKWD